MFDEYIHGLGEFVRDDDYDFYDLFIDIIDGTTEYLECEILILEIWKIWTDYVDVFLLQGLLTHRHRPHPPSLLRGFTYSGGWVPHCHLHRSVHHPVTLSSGPGV